MGDEHVIPAKTTDSRISRQMADATDVPIALNERSPASFAERGRHGSNDLDLLHEIETLADAAFVSVRRTICFTIMQPIATGGEILLICGQSKG